MMKHLRKLARNRLESKGYWFRHRKVLPFGIDFIWDIKRLAQELDINIRTIFDVGAHHGQTTQLFLRNFPNARVFSFEPDAETFVTLSKNLNHEGQCRLENIALSNVSGLADFFTYGREATCNSLVSNSPFSVYASSQSASTKVSAMKLDEYCETNAVSDVELLKIDTEGHEREVLEGASRVLSTTNAGFVYCEFNYLTLKEGAHGGALMPVAEILEPLGYVFISTFPVLLRSDRGLFVTNDALFAKAP